MNTDMRMQKLMETAKRVNRDHFKAGLQITSDSVGEGEMHSKFGGRQNADARATP